MASANVVFPVVACPQRARLIIFSVIYSFKMFLLILINKKSGFIRRINHIIVLFSLISMSGNQV
jgi:hypothetical protein